MLAYICIAKNPAMNNLFCPQNISQAPFASTSSLADGAFVFGVGCVASAQPVWVGCTQLAGGQSGFSRNGGVWAGLRERMVSAN